MNKDRKPAMTALPAPTRRTATLGHTPGRQLLAAAIVGAIGVVVLSIAFGQFVTGSRHDLPVAVASDARSLVGGAPFVALIAIVHFAVAWGLASGRRVVEPAARLATGGAAVAAGTLAVAIATGLTGLASTGPDPKQIVALATLAGAYTAAALLAGGDSRH